MAGAIATAAAAKKEVALETKEKTLKDWVQVMEGQFAKALPKVMTAERFTRIALSALSRTPKLMDCTRSSFLGALMQAAQLGLEPNTPLGQAYLIPFENTKEGIVECQFQIGYKGLLDLCYRSGEIASIQAHVVYENDKFEYELGLESVLKHTPAMEKRGESKFVYGVFKLKNGGYGFEVMSMADIKSHASKYSQAYKTGYSPWKTNFEEMAKKTILKRVLKYAPLRSDFITLAEVSDSATNIYNDRTTEVTVDYVREQDGKLYDADTGVVVTDSEPVEVENNERIGE